MKSLVLTILLVSTVLFCSCDKETPIDESGKDFKLEGTTWKSQGNDNRMKQFEFTSSIGGILRVNYGSVRFSYNYDDDLRTGQMVIERSNPDSYWIIELNSVFTINKEHTQMIVNSYRRDNGNLFEAGAYKLE